MFIAYVILLYSCFILTISDLTKVTNYLASYFIVSATTTTARLFSSSNDVISKSSHIYYSLIILASIIGLTITSKNYKYFVLIVTLILLYCSNTFNLDFYTNNYVFTLEIVIFIFVGIYKELFKKFYFYLFIILLVGAFINNIWLIIIRQNKEILHGLKHIELYNIVSCFYLITFYIIFIIYHVKYRVNK